MKRPLSSFIIHDVSCPEPAWSFPRAGGCLSAELALHYSNERARVTGSLVAELILSV